MAGISNVPVLVTGADGFIGSHLAEQLVAGGAKVRVLSQYNSFNDWGWLEQLPCLEQLDVVVGDIRDAHFCEELTRGVDIVFHLAALIPIPYSYRAPDSFVDTNVKGTLYLCQAALRSGVKRFIQTSTSEVYGTAQYVPIDEKHPLQPQSPYSATKIASDCIALSFHYSFGLPVVVARPFNTYGPRQSARAVIPSIIIQIANGKSEISLGSLSTTRDFTYVEDTCRGFIKIAEMNGGEGEVFHIGSNHEIAVGDLVKLISKIAGTDVKVVCDEARLRPQKSEVHRLRCDNSKLRSTGAFVPQISLYEGLERTVRWFTQPENLRRYKGSLYNV
ncbi:MAG TPA: SDR family NAD(P)-dependent oxidoreductase [Candidatus Sulfotelmatobacter sp.]|nr:SDR family NAD(P)-dependent oxidoreductase [Candidatus Sulfotelmatobacter sp.]